MILSLPTVSNADVMSVFRRAHDELFERLTTVRLRLCDLTDCYGIATKGRGPDRFYIRLQRGLPRVTAWDTLIHECAHVIAWDWRHHDTDHGPHWGLAYSHCYQIIMRFL